MITSEPNKILTGSEINMMKLEKGEQVEFQCYTPQSGTFYGEKRSPKKLSINHQGYLSIKDMEPNKNNFIEASQTYSLTDLLKVIIGKESNSEDIKVTLIIDPFNQRIKGR